MIYVTMLLLTLTLLTRVNGQQTVADIIEGFATNVMLMTDAVGPAIRGFNVRTYASSTPFSYTLENVIELGVSRMFEGCNRTLRPHGIVLYEGEYADSIYWADAGAGAILGLRFDSSGLHILAHGLNRPEHVAIDTSEESRLAGGALLYWGDSGANKIQRCRIVGQSGAGTCESTPTDVLVNVPLLGGLAWHSGRLYWADGLTSRVLSAALNPLTGLVFSPSVVEVASAVAIPMAIAFAAGSGDLYVLDQERPTSLGRVLADSNETGVERLLHYGLSRPRAVVFAEGQGRMLLVDSGTRSILALEMGEAEPTTHTLPHIREDADFEPRGATARSDLAIYLQALDFVAEEQTSSADASGRRLGTSQALVTTTALVAWSARRCVARAHI